MPTKRTLRARGWRPELSPYQVFELLTGEIIYPMRGYTGYGDGGGTDLCAFISDEMRTDWKQNRDRLLEFWISGSTAIDQLAPNWRPWLFTYGAPGTRPWAWWELEDHPTIDDDESEAEYLARLDLWLDGERELIERASRSECIGEHAAARRRKP
jgi:hypothetical protein